MSILITVLSKKNYKFVDSFVLDAPFKIYLISSKSIIFSFVKKKYFDNYYKYDKLRSTLRLA